MQVESLDAGGIQTYHIDLNLNDPQLLQTQEGRLQNTLFRPAVYPDINHMPIAVFFGQAPPFAPILHDVQHCIQYFQITDFCWLPMLGKTLFYLLILLFL